MPRPPVRSAHVGLVVVLSLLVVACASSGPALVATETTDAAPSETAVATDETAVDSPTAEGDSGEGDDPVATDDTAAEPTTATEATASPAPAGDSSEQATPSGQPAATTRPTAAGDCDADMAGTPVAQAESSADIDGDGVDDLILTYATEGARGIAWRLRAETAAGESLDSPLDIEPGFDSGVEPLGGADIDGDGSTDELLTIIGSGASSRIVAIHQRSGCNLVQAGIGGAPTSFPVGGSIGNIAGLECIDTDENGVPNGLIAWSGTADFDGEEGRYFIDGVTYELRGTELQQVATRTFTANIREADFVYGQLSCGSVNL